MTHASAFVVGRHEHASASRRKDLIRVWVQLSRLEPGAIAENRSKLGFCRSHQERDVD